MASVMVDIETDGPDPGRHRMLQFAAVEFDDTWTVQREFNMYLDPHQMTPEGHQRTWSKDTMDWWMKNPIRRVRFQQIQDRCRHGTPPDTVMRVFHEWLPVDETLVWAWPTCFDISFLQSYARDYFPLLSQRLWRNADVRSWMSGCIATAGAPMGIDDKTRPPFEGEEHDALFDAKWQVWLMGKFEKDLNRWRRGRAYKEYPEDFDLL